LHPSGRRGARSRPVDVVPAPGHKTKLSRAA
jgi:hypothetical protein